MHAVPVNMSVVVHTASFSAHEICVGMITPVRHLYGKIHPHSLFSLFLLINKNIWQGSSPLFILLISKVIL